MAHCVPLTAHSRRETILLAVGEHDNGWTEADDSPTVDPATGTIVDFVGASLSVRHSVWPRGVARLAGNPWAAALVAQHAITVYDRFRPDPHWTTFFDQMTALRDGLLAGSGFSLADLLDDYRYVRLADLISLTFCTAWTGEHSFGGWTVRLDDSRVIVTPDVFGGAEIPIEIQAKSLPRQTFGSDAELHDALRCTGMVTLSGTVAGATDSRTR